MNTVKRYNPEQPKASLLGGMLLYILPVPLLFAAISGLMSDQTSRAIAYALGFTVCMVAATMMRRGLAVAAEAKRRKINRRTSTIPYKMVAAILLAAAMFIVAWGGGNYGLIDGALFGFAALVGAYLLYGFDEARNDPDVAAIGITSEEVIELLDEAEGRIVAIETARRDIRNSEFRDRLKHITEEARTILSIIEEDPRDARRARKFLKVYLDGAKQVTEGYAAAHKGEDSPELEDNFRRVLTTIETVIAEQQKKLRENNLSELDVQIEVLQMQLEKEGVT